MGKHPEQSIRNLIIEKNLDKKGNNQIGKV